MKWRTLAADRIRLRCWDDECVLYDSDSGDTHLLGEAARRILSVLQHAPADLQTLTASLSAEWNLQPTEDFSDQIAAVLADLQRLSLVEGLK